MATVAEMIDRYRDDIMNAWASEAQKAASARGLSQPELRNLLPQYLVTLRDSGAGESMGEYFASHLAGRIRQGFDLSEIVEEFVLLEQCISDLWPSMSPQDRPAEADRQTLSAVIRRTIVQVTAMFHEHMELDEQREKRYLRLLQSIASEALRAPEAPFLTRLEEILQVILEATGADAASVLLYEPETGRLTTSASAGAAQRELSRLAASLDLDSLGGKVAESSGSTQAEDVYSIGLEVTEELRRAEIHSLLGIRLSHRHKLIGILLIGLREERPFTAREIRRLEALGDRLTLHLDNAQLYAELRRHVDELTLERDLRERFVAILAHDLRGPLSAAKTGSQLLVRYPERLDRRRHLAVRLERNLDRMERMIRDLLDVSRLGAGGRLPLRLDSCDLDLVAEEVVEELSATYGDRFELGVPQKVRGIWSHEELRRALWNLGVNAVKYGAPESPIAIRVEHAPGGARLSVHNLGNPIPAGDVPRLFSLYQRLGAGVQPGGGWGLGLALVRACAEAHGGRVEVQSSPEAGTRFSLYLPADSRPYQPPPPEREAIPSAGGVQAP